MSNSTYNLVYKDITFFNSNSEQNLVGYDGSNDFFYNMLIQRNNDSQFNSKNNEAALPYFKKESKVPELDNMTISDFIENNFNLSSDSDINALNAFKTYLIKLAKDSFNREKIIYEAICDKRFQSQIDAVNTFLNNPTINKTSIKEVYEKYISILRNFTAKYQKAFQDEDKKIAELLSVMISFSNTAVFRGQPNYFDKSVYKLLSNIEKDPGVDTTVKYISSMLYGYIIGSDDLSPAPKMNLSNSTVLVQTADKVTNFSKLINETDESIFKQQDLSIENKQDINIENFKKSALKYLTGSQKFDKDPTNFYKGPIGTIYKILFDDKHGIIYKYCKKGGFLDKIFDGTTTYQNRELSQTILNILNIKFSELSNIGKLSIEENNKQQSSDGVAVSYIFKYDNKLLKTYLTNRKKTEDELIKKIQLIKQEYIKNKKYQKKYNKLLKDYQKHLKDITTLISCLNTVFIKAETYYKNFIVFKNTKNNAKIIYQELYNLNVNSTSNTLVISGKIPHNNNNEVYTNVINDIFDEEIKNISKNFLPDALNDNLKEPIDTKKLTIKIMKANRSNRYKLFNDKTLIQDKIEAILIQDILNQLDNKSNVSEPPPKLDYRKIKNNLATQSQYIKINDKQLHQILVDNIKTKGKRKIKTNDNQEITSLNWNNIFHQPSWKDFCKLFPKEKQFKFKYFQQWAVEAFKITINEYMKLVVTKESTLDNDKWNSILTGALTQMCSDYNTIGNVYDQLLNPSGLSQTAKGIFGEIYSQIVGFLIGQKIIEKKGNQYKFYVRNTGAVKDSIALEQAAADTVLIITGEGETSVVGIQAKNYSTSQKHSDNTQGHKVEQYSKNYNLDQLSSTLDKYLFGMDWQLMKFIIANSGGLKETINSNCIGQLQNIMQLYSASFSRMLQKQSLSKTIKIKNKKGEQIMPQGVVSNMIKMINKDTGQIKTMNNSSSIDIINNFAFVGTDLIVSSTAIALRDLMVIQNMRKNFDKSKLLMSASLYLNNSLMSSAPKKFLSKSKEKLRTVNEAIGKEVKIHTENYWNYNDVYKGTNFAANLLAF